MAALRLHQFVAPGEWRVGCRMQLGHGRSKRELCGDRHDGTLRVAHSVSIDSGKSTDSFNDLHHSAECFGVLQYLSRRRSKLVAQMTSDFRRQGASDAVTLGDRRRA